MKTEYLILDLETAPLPYNEMNKWLPEMKLWNPDKFDPDKVAIGNLKDVVKIEAKKKLARKASEEKHYQDLKDKRFAIRDKAALNPNTGWIFGVGVSTPDSNYCKLTLEMDEERDIIEHCWEMITNTRCLVNHNLIGFDLAFLVARSMLLDITIPFSVCNLPKWSGSDLFLTGNPNPIKLIDTMQVASRFAPTSYPSLNWCAKFFSLESKVDLDGLLPWDMARQDFDKACEYTERDTELTKEVAFKLQCI